MVCTNMACNYLVTRLEALGDRKPAPRQPSIPSIGGRLSPDCCRSHAPWGAFTIANDAVAKLLRKIHGSESRSGL